MSGNLQNAGKEAEVATQSALPASVKKRKLMLIFGIISMILIFAIGAIIYFDVDITSIFQSKASPDDDYAVPFAYLTGKHHAPMEYILIAHLYPIPFLGEYVLVYSGMFSVASAGLTDDWSKLALLNENGNPNAPRLRFQLEQYTTKPVDQGLANLFLSQYFNKHLNQVYVLNIKHKWLEGSNELEGLSQILLLTESAIRFNIDQCEGRPCIIGNTDQSKVHFYYLTTEGTIYESWIDTKEDLTKIISYHPTYPIVALEVLDLAGEEVQTIQLSEEVKGSEATTEESSDDEGEE